mgnify:CR=1 FL=1
MSGNVWEFIKNNFDVNYYNAALKQGEISSLKGSNIYSYPDNPYQKEKVIKGDSFLCNKTYCASYRISAGMSLYRIQVLVILHSEPLRELNNYVR